MWSSSAHASSGQNDRRKCTVAVGWLGPKRHAQKKVYELRKINWVGWLNNHCRPSFEHNSSGGSGQLGRPSERSRWRLEPFRTSPQALPYTYELYRGRTELSKTKLICENLKKNSVELLCLYTIGVRQSSSSWVNFIKPRLRYSYNLCTFLTFFP